MKLNILIYLLLIQAVFAQSQNRTLDLPKVEEDLNMLLDDLSNNYAYWEEKKIDINCLREHYSQKVAGLKTEADAVLLFEYLLDEFYDSHLILNTNTPTSFRLYAPIYAQLINGKPIISNVWQSQMEPLEVELIGAEIQQINGVNFDQAIEYFPTHCQDKNDPIVREWIANKLLAGRYNEKRVLTLKLRNQKVVPFDLDEIVVKKEAHLLDFGQKKNIGWIRINNSLGQDALVNAFDSALNVLSETQGLVLDLRNTVDGGDTYEARGIMGRFIQEPTPYQMHAYVEKAYDNPAQNPLIKRLWMELVVPRGKVYQGKVVVLVGRWTGSMGEGLAIGFDGMKRATVVGTEMERLAGEIEFFPFQHRSYGYRLPVAKLFHVAGTPREQFVPKHYVKQQTNKRDEAIEKAFEMLAK